MPKPIKKRPVKPEAQQEDVQEVFSKLAEQAAERKRTLAMAGIAVLVVILIASGAYLFNKSANQRALQLESEAFMLYSGVYESETERTQALEKAVTGFREAHATRPTAFRKYFVAETLYRLGRYEDTLNALDEFDSEYSSNMRFTPVSKLKRALTYRAMGNNESALTTLQEFNFISSKSLKDYALIQTAELLETMGRKDEAQQYYNQVLTEHPESRFAEVAQSRVEETALPPGFQDAEQQGQEPFSIELK